MKTIELSGIIKYEYHEWSTIKLIQPDGYKIDLVGRFKEIKESYPKCAFQVNYWLSDKPCSKDEMLEKWLNKLYGDISANYEQEEYRYSSWTSGINNITTLQIGGHDLLSELPNEEGKFLIFEINMQDKMPY